MEETKNTELSPEEKAAADLQAQKDEAMLKAEALTKEIGKKVSCLFVKTPTGLAIGYVQEPHIRNKIAAINYLAAKQVDLSGELILNASILKEQSDPRFCIGGGDDIVYASAALACNQFVELYDVELKKN
jgi:hypothetical protein